MTRNFYHSPPTTWSELYKGWLTYSEFVNQERKNGWKPTENSLLLAALTGRVSPSSK